MSRRIWFHCDKCDASFTARASVWNGYAVTHKRCGRIVYPMYWEGLLPE